jgi:hypothetical protein
MADTEPHAFHPECYVAHKDPDTLSWSEAVDDVMACAKITVLEANNSCNEVTESNTNGKIIPGTWVLANPRRRNKEVQGASLLLRRLTR